MAKDNSECIFISAKKKENIEAFKKLLYDRVKEIHITRYPYDHFLY
jgi:GTP-binding protein HflX